MEKLQFDFRGIPEVLTGALQENVVTLAAVSDLYCKMVVLNVKLELYSNEVLREVATGIYNYVHDYGKAPRDHLPDLFEARLKGDDPRATMLYEALQNIRNLSQGGFNEVYVVNQLNKFVRQQHLKGCVADLFEAAEVGDIDKADNSIDAYRKTNFTQFDPGLKMLDYVRTIGSTDRARPVIDLGIPRLDRAELGPARQELHMLLAPPKRGKTWWLVHLAKRALLARLRTVYVTLEVSPEIIAGRLLQSFFAMPRSESESIKVPEVVRKDDKITAYHMKEAAARIALTSKSGIAKVKGAFGLNKRHISQVGRLMHNLTIKSYPTGSLKLKELETYLENLVAYERFMPDVVLLDYADLMYIPSERYRIELGLLAKQLRGLAVERNFALATASQSNRSSVTKRLITEQDVAEDFSKIAISDVVLSYNQTGTEREAQAARLYVAAARNSRDRFQVNITQAYELGQFCIDSFYCDPRSYEELMADYRRPDERDAHDDPHESVD